MCRLLPAAIHRMALPRPPQGRLIVALSLAALIAGAVALPHAHAPSEQPAALDALFDGYARGQVHILQQQITTEAHYNAVRSQLDARRKLWARERLPIHAVFHLDLALVGVNRQWDFWLDVIVEGLAFVTSRPDAPGASPAEDARELAWHQAAAALMFGVGRPDYLRARLLDPLEDRVAVAPNIRPGPRLVDPWYALLRGQVEELWIVREPASLPVRSALALQHYGEAAQFAATRDEALVRTAWLHLRMKRPADALTSLDALTASIDDPAVRYWRMLFRGRALEDLTRLDDAAAAYEGALAIVPQAQAPAIALTSLELSRDDVDRAFTWSARARNTPDDVRDPWWDYTNAEFRHFQSRLVALRKAALMRTAGRP